jgi:AraC family transcriptional regulator, arabinose operon regulatory protein
MDPRVRKVVEILEAEHFRPISVGDLASRVNLSESRLRHIFKAEMGKPLTRFLKELRMARAKSLLETTFASVKEIMSQTGLHDESHFVRDFERLYGISPRRWRAARAFDPTVRARVSAGRGLR